METFERNLRDTIFRTEPKASTTRTAFSGLHRTDTVYVLSQNATSAQREALLAYLTLCGTSLDPDRGLWRTYVLTEVVAAFPSLGKKIIQASPNLYTQVTLESSALEAMCELKTIAKVWKETPLTDDQGTRDARKTFIDTIPFLEHLPAPNHAKMTAEYVTCFSVEALYGHVSLVLFLAGKTITEQNRGAMTQRRPQAIQNKYNLGPVACLTGSVMLSNVAHEQIHVAFVTMNTMRAVLFEDIAKFSSEKGDLGVEVAATTTRLMAYSGMQHVRLIDMYLAAMPEAGRIPVLAASLQSYVASLKTLLNVSPELRPFYKLIHGDTTRAFNRKDVEALLVVAITHEKATSPTLEQYNLPDNADRIIAKYQQYLKQLEAENKDEED